MIESLYNFKIKDHTTYKIGGTADCFTLCNSLEEMHVAFSRLEKLPWFLIGNGSNILVSDEGFPGMLIKLGGEFKKIIFNQDSVQVGGGVLLPTLSHKFMARGWGGFEFMCDIPGTIGGAVRINAGTKQGEIKDSLISAEVLTPAGEIKTIPRDDIGFSYRHSRLADTRDIVLSASFSRQYDSDRATIQKKIKDIIAARRKKQPGIKQNCGSVFKNPAGGKTAAWYIDQAGLKGFRMGDAMIAHEHANWIVNLKHARAKDVKGIIEHVRQTISREYGIMLEREVIYVPEDIL